MKITTPKTLFPLLGRPMIAYALDALREAGMGRPLIVTSPALRSDLKNALGGGMRFVVQPSPRGTGDAVARLKGAIPRPTTLVVINADSPLFEPGHIRALLTAHREAGALVSFATAIVDDPSGLGRVLRDPAGAVANIVEDAEASPAVKRVREINAGLYAFEVPAIFELLGSIEPVGAKREKYLTRAVELAISRGLAVTTVSVPAEASIGVNTLAEAAQAQAALLARKLAALMSEGVSIDDPSAVSVDWGVIVGPGSRIMPGTILSGKTRAGENCLLGPHAVMKDAEAGDDVEVRSSWVTGSRLGDRAVVGPFAHVRPGCTVGKGAHVGTHAEIVRTTLGERVRMHHFSYLGDATVAADANIGAGAVSANFDGKKKQPTRIGKGAFIGSGAVLVAPASVGNGAVVGAGAVVPARRPVPAKAVVAGVPAGPLKRK